MSGYHPSVRPPGHSSQVPFPGPVLANPDSFGRDSVITPPGLASVAVPAHSPNAIPGLTWGSIPPPSTFDLQASSQLPANSQAEVPQSATEAAPQTHAMGGGATDAEDGELDEAVFEDLYEPYEDPVDVTRFEQSSHESEVDEDDIYIPPEPSKFSIGGEDNDRNARERSRSYSPYLSPSEQYGSSSAEGPGARTPIHGKLGIVGLVHRLALTFRSDLHCRSFAGKFISFRKRNWSATARIRQRPG
jgi:hypothetical protein